MSETLVGINGAAGRMGKRLVALVHESDDLTLGAALEHASHPDLGKDAGEIAGVGNLGVALSKEVPHDQPLHVVIDFSVPEGTAQVLQLCTSRRIPLVLATTGHTAEQNEEIEAAAHETALLRAPNMSLSVNVLFALTEQTAKMLKDRDFDVEIIERHHRYKQDAPSGTALKFAEIVRDVMEQTEMRHGREGIVGERPRAEIGLHAVRVGDNVGEHTIIFSALGETIELVHKAHSRDSYARGAIQAARYLADQPPGRYSMKDVLGL